MTDLLDRFLDKIDVQPAQPDGTSGCWLWTASLDRNGYSQIGTGDKRVVSGHQVGYQLFVGQVPVGLELDHVKARGCVHRHCVNPQHLEPVTHQENMRRGAHAVKTHCPAGHPYEGDNLYVNPNNGDRLCQSCRRQHRANYLAKKAAS